MMTKTLVALGALGGALIVAATTVIPASAAIKCQGRNQWNSAVNGWIATPYCEDKLIAQVTGYSFQAIRTNPSSKAEACRFKGQDTRIKDLCAGHLPENNGPRRH